MRGIRIVVSEEPAKGGEYQSNRVSRGGSRVQLSEESVIAIWAAYIAVAVLVLVDMLVSYLCR